VERVDKHDTVDSKGLTFQVMFVHFKQDLPGNRWTEHFYQKLENDHMVKVMTGYRKFFWKVYYNQSADKDKSPKKVPHIMTPEEEAEVAVAKAYKEAIEAQHALDQGDKLVAEVAAELTDPAAAEDDVVLSTVD